MKRKELMDALGEIDPRLAEAADPDTISTEEKSGVRKSKAQFRRPLQIAAMAACAALVVLAVSLISGRERRTSSQSGSDAAALLDGTEEGVLYEDEYVTVWEAGAAKKKKKGNSATYSSSGQLTSLSERELFTEPVTVLRAEVTAKEQLTVESKVIPGQFFTYSVLTLKPVRAVCGKEIPLDKPVRILLSHYSEFGGTLINAAQEGTEGFFSLYEGYGTGWTASFADYLAGDQLRYAILEGPDGLLFEKTAYISFDRSWDLDKAEEHIKELVALSELPEDFTFSFDFEVLGNREEDDLARSYDSETGLLVLGGRLSHKEDRSREEFSLKLSDETLRLICDSLRKLNDVTVDGPGGNGRENASLKLKWRENGQPHCVSYSGWALNNTAISDSETDLIRGVYIEIVDYMADDPAYRKIDP